MGSISTILKKMFGSKAERDMKQIKPLLDKILSIYPSIDKLSDDELREATLKIKKTISDYVAEERAKKRELREKLEDINISAEEKEQLASEVDKLTKKIDEKIEEVLEQVLPEAFAIMTSTARRFKEKTEIRVKAYEWDKNLAAKKDFVKIEGDEAVWSNSWLAGGNTITWDRVHYDVQLIGGIVLHQGKISEMATGEGKTLVATLPIYLNSLAGKGVHVVTVNDYLAKRDSEWMGMLFEFHGLSVDCIDKHEPNSEERRQAYNCDVTYGTNNEFGFDYLRDNMCSNINEIVQREHNYAIVDEVDSVLIDDARTPLIISGPTPKGEDQEFDRFCPIIEKLYNVQRQEVNQIIADARKKLESDNNVTDQDKQQGGILLLRAHHGLPKTKALIKLLSEPGMRALKLKTENFYMQDQGKEMHVIDDDLYFVIDEQQNTIELTEKGMDFLAKLGEDPKFYQLPDVGSQLAELEQETITV